MLTLFIHATFCSDALRRHLWLIVPVCRAVDIVELPDGGDVGGALGVRRHPGVRVPTHYLVPDQPFPAGKRELEMKKG